MRRGPCVMAHKWGTHPPSCAMWAHGRPHSLPTEMFTKETRPKLQAKPMKR